MARTSNLVGLEALLTGPYSWNAVTYSNFIRDAYDNVIKEEVERLQNIEKEKRIQADQANSRKKKTGSTTNLQNFASQPFDKDISELVQQLVDESEQVLGKEDWVAIIGANLWNILKLDEFSKDRYKLDDVNDDIVISKRKSVVQLAKFNRNKTAHIRTMSEQVKKELSVFFDKDAKGQYHLNENKYSMFWISKFPKLVPYLWLKLYKFKDKLESYYPDYEIDVKKFEDILMNLNKLEKELKTALFSDMENGNVLKRFKGPGCSSLEFRGCRSHLIKNVVISVTVDSTDNVLVSVSHFSTIKEKLEYNTGTVQGTQKLTIISTDIITDDNIWKISQGFGSRVIIFSDPEKLTNEKIDEAVGKFGKLTNIELDEYPITGHELSVQRQDLLFNEGKVSIQGRDINIRDIFVDSSSSTMVGVVSGYLLNKLLRNDKPLLFAEYKYPEIEGVYVKRRLSFPKYNKINTRPEYEPLYIVTNVPEEARSEMCGKYIQKFRDWIHLLSEKYKVKGNCTLVWLEKCEEISEDIIELFQKVFKLRTVIYEEYDDHIKRKVLNENEFMQTIISNEIKTIYILAVSGMGKTKLIISLGNKLANSLVIFSTFRHFLDCVKEQVGNEDCTKADIKSVICNRILGSKNSCERILIDKWLDRKSGKGALIDLQLDALDEVPRTNLGLAVKVIEIIQNEFDAIRLWITSVKPFPNKRLDHSFTYCTISPLLYYDQFKIFEHYWKGKETKKYRKGIFKSFHSEVILKRLLPAGFIYSPLNCSMIAQVYDYQISKVRDYLSFRKIFNGVDLYEALCRKKFAIMYKEKKGVQLDENDEDYKMQRENYFHMHSYLALVYLFPELANEFVMPPSMQYWSVENYHKMGILESEPLAFIHKTFAEYFAARCIFKVLESGELDTLFDRPTFEKLLTFCLPGLADETFYANIYDFLEQYRWKLNHSIGLGLLWFKRGEKWYSEEEIWNLFQIRTMRQYYVLPGLP